jgi:6-phosphogluconolactonase (cycloisomerase 2 family)
MSLTSSNGTYLYVLNSKNTSQIATQGSSITAYHINAQGQLQDNPDSTSNPYSVGSGPVCIVEDPSNQYLYITNGTDSTITGKVFDPTRGFLSPLTRGSVFPVTMNPTCLAVSGNV